jgi:hypothetical protein
MLNKYFIAFITNFLLTFSLWGQQEQHPFPYEVNIRPITINGLDGHHSFAIGNYQYSYLLVGGRRDGIHARQPFNAFPKQFNNTDLVVIDVIDKTTLYYPLKKLPLNLQEHLQSSNMNFIQVGNLLLIIGGYAYSGKAKDHITFPYLTIIHLRETIEAIKSNKNPSPFIQQVKDERMAVTGGQLALMDSTFYLIGGHRFDGRYNPMDNPTFVQTYSDEIASFKIETSTKKISITNYKQTKDIIHLRRRDFNLLSRIDANGAVRFTISAGVFQLQIDAPFTYPIDIESEQVYYPHTEFTQYLSSYHSAKASFYSKKDHTNTTLFFGGLSQFYWRNDSLIYDEEVPFVKTLSILHRNQNNQFSEYGLAQEMPAYLGTSAEFLPHPSLPAKQNVLFTDAFQTDTVLIGYLLGGIESNSRNPFQNNETELTRAHEVFYQVELIKSDVALRPMDNFHEYRIAASAADDPNKLLVKYSTNAQEKIQYYVTLNHQKLLRQGEIIGSKIGSNEVEIEIDEPIIRGQTKIVFVFDQIHFSEATIK